MLDVKNEPGRETMNIDDRLKALTQRLLRLEEAIEADRKRFLEGVPQPSQLIADRMADRERIQALLRIAESRLNS